MIYGNVNNEFFEQHVAILPKPLGDALRFLKTADLANHAPGRFPMDLNGVDVILQVMDLETKPREAAKPEIHDGSSFVHSDELATERDILFYENNSSVPENSVYLTPGAYAIYLPWDVHVPGLSADGQARAFRKIVMKVPMSACL